MSKSVFASILGASRGRRTGSRVEVWRQGEVSAHQKTSARRGAAVGFGRNARSGICATLIVPAPLCESRLGQRSTRKRELGPLLPASDATAAARSVFTARAILGAQVRCHRR